MPPAGIDAQTLALVDALERCTLTEFGHDDHVRVAWCHAMRTDLATMLRVLPAQLRRYAAAQGHPERYHATITFAFACLVHERVARDPTRSWPRFAAANRDLFDRTLLRRYYSRDVLDSPLARRVFLWPASAPAEARPGPGLAS